MLVWNYDRESYDATYNENLVDKMFIGHMKIGGAEALAGLEVTTPVIFIGIFFNYMEKNRFTYSVNFSFASDCSESNDRSVFGRANCRFCSSLYDEKLQSCK